MHKGKCWLNSKPPKPQGQNLHNMCNLQNMCSEHAPKSEYCKSNIESTIIMNKFETHEAFQTNTNVTVTSKVTFQSNAPPDAPNSLEQIQGPPQLQARASTKQSLTNSPPSSPIPTLHQYSAPNTHPHHAIPQDSTRRHPGLELQKAPADHPGNC